MAKATVTIMLEGLDRHKTLAKVQKALRSESIILRQIGAFFVAQGKRAFQDQRLGDEAWPARYGGRSPICNIAGVVADLLSGRTEPKAIRFKSRPAGIDSGDTLRNMTVDQVIRVEGKKLIIMAPTEQARKMQSENRMDRTSEQHLTKAMKKRMAAWMKKARRRVKKYKSSKRDRAGKFKTTSATLRQGDTAAASLGWLFRRTTLVTHAARRPIFGITEELAGRITKMTAGSLKPPGVPGRVS